MQPIIKPFPPAQHLGESMAERERRHFQRLDQLKRHEKRQERRRRILQFFGL